MTTMTALEGRTARCICGSVVASTTPHIAFFEYRGEGSRSATTTCKNCRYAEVAHTDEARRKNPRLLCTTFEPHGAFEFDSFYCGCRGFD